MPSLSRQVKRNISKPVEVEPENKGNFDIVISTGSTLLDLAISGKRIRGGGLPGGVFVEVSGPSQSGKTALLCEIAGAVNRKGGEFQFYDPEARLDYEFASIFGMSIEPEKYFMPDTVTEVFKNVRAWEPKSKQKVNGVFADSLTALSTDLEMENEDGDKMGGRRAKEFSEQLRKTCRIIKRDNLLMVCTNQLRQTMSTYGAKWTQSCGEAIKFYSSIRLEVSKKADISKEVSFRGTKITQVIGIESEIYVSKTVGVPYTRAPLIIIYGYGIDDVRANLQYVKKYTGNTVFAINGKQLSNILDTATRIVEQNGLESELKEEVINLWEEIDTKFDINRKKAR